MRNLLFAVLFMFIGCADLFSQDRDSVAKYMKFEETGTFEFLFTYFPPFFIQNTLELKAFIRSSAFRRIRKEYGDLRAADAIFIRSMALTKDNTAIALLLSTFATFDHRLVGLKIPVFSLFFPLTNESEEEFVRRVNNLPDSLYHDTPSSIGRDRDKLQHFFGSAFISNVFESSQPAERVAQFIEFGEEAIIVEGTADERDLRANRQGGEFGLALLQNNHRLPSMFFRPECRPDTSGARSEGRYIENKEQE